MKRIGYCCLLTRKKSREIMPVREKLLTEGRILRRVAFDGESCSHCRSATTSSLSSITSFFLSRFFPQSDSADNKRQYPTRLIDMTRICNLYIIFITYFAWTLLLIMYILPDCILYM